MVSKTNLTQCSKCKSTYSNKYEVCPVCNPGTLRKKNGRARGRKRPLPVGDQKQQVSDNLSDQVVAKIRERVEAYRACKRKRKSVDVSG